MKKSPYRTPFAYMELAKPLVDAVEKLGYEKPTTIQKLSIPRINEGRDILAGAETGSGKTAAYALPTLNKIIAQKEEEGFYGAKGAHVRALVLVPTRELAMQVSDAIEEYAQYIQPEIKCKCVFGGTKLEAQIAKLKSGTDVLVGTPGRLLDLIEHNAIKFNKLRTTVVDEVDRMITGNFKTDIEKIFKKLPNSSQNLMFTATFPESVRELVRKTLDNPEIINLEPGEDVHIDQHAITVNRDKKTALLAHLIKDYDWEQTLVFCSAKRSCDKLVEQLKKHEINAIALHGNKEQKERIQALNSFKSGETNILIATDVAARGLDIESLPCVINYELPRDPNDYTHRIGRTGRAGKPGLALSLIAHHEYTHFSAIEKRIRIHMKREQIEGFEADEQAPPSPQRKKPKKAKKRKSVAKKKQQQLKEKRQK